MRSGNSNLPASRNHAETVRRPSRLLLRDLQRARACAAQGIDLVFVQDNHSLSKTAGVLRGLHYQLPPFAQDKLVRVTRGAILDVAVDIRKSSPTFGRWLALEVSAEKWNQILVPKGFAHGFVTLVPDTEVHLQGDRALCAGARPIDPLRRSGDRHRLAGLRCRRHPVGQGPRRAASRRCRDFRIVGNALHDDGVGTSGRIGEKLMNILVTGGAGFIGSARLPASSRQSGPPRRQRRQADLCRQSRLAAPDRELSQLPLRARPTSATPRRSPTCCAGTRSTSSCIWRPKAMSTARSTGRPPSSRPISSARSACLTAALAYWRSLVGRQARRLPLPPRLDRRGLRRSAVRQRHLHRGHALRAVLALFGVEGRVGSSGARLARDLRPAGRASPTAPTITARSISRKS